MIIRIRSKDGQFRITVDAADDASKLGTELLKQLPQIDLSTLTLSNQPRGAPEMKLDALRGTSIADLGLSHGHMLYANYQGAAGNEPEPAAPAPTSSNAAPSAGPSAAAKQPPASSIPEAQVDQYWDSQDGKIVRQRDPHFCRHGPQGMCDYCMPLEPYDSKYQQEHNIKHISFHALLKQKDAAANKAQGSSWIAPLEEEDYRVKAPCPSGQHPDWPAGICTKCQPSAITLQRQPFRMVDHVEFAHPSLIENVLRFWRSTASQRFGFLLGKYEPYPVVPMGIKAKVEAIHEPPQEGELDGITLGWPWEQKAEMEELAAKCGMEVLGMIYTDLTAETEKRKREDGQEDPNPVPTGRVLAKRHAKSFFLSGNEVLFAAHMQNMFHYYTKYAENGRFGSRFVTCVVSGQPGGEIGVEAYQVSLQAEAIARANMVQPSVQPNTMRIATNESAAKSAPPEENVEGKALAPVKPYIPEVFYRYKNKYGLDVKESAKPTFPVEYLLVNVTNGFPTAPNPLFESSDFPIENRPGLEDQSTEVLLGRLHKVLGNAELEPLPADSSGVDADDGLRRKLVAFLSDWHLLAFVPSTGLLANDEFNALVQVAVSHDTHAALDKLLSMPGWKTLSTLAREHAPSASGGAALDDDELTPEEIAAIIASTEASHIDTASSSNPPTGSRASPIDVGAHTPSSHRPPPPVAPARPRVAEDDAYLYDGGNDDVPFGAVSDSDDEAVFEDSHSRTSWEPHQTHMVIDDDDSDVQMGDATAAAPAPPPQPTEVACPTCTVLNPASNDTCFLCGLPMHI